MSRLIWIYAVCKSLLLSPVAVKELTQADWDVRLANMFMFAWRTCSKEGVFCPKISVLTWQKLYFK